MNTKKKDKMLPPMPDAKPWIQLDHIQAELMWDPKRFSSGSMGMIVESAKVHETVDGVKAHVGDVYFYIGGGVGVHDVRTGRTYGFGMKEVWAAFQDQVEHVPNVEGSPERKKKK